MYTYKIVSKNSEPKFKNTLAVNEIVHYVSPDCEVFEISDDIDYYKEVSLGFLTEKHLIYIANEIIKDFVIKKSFKHVLKTRLEKTNLFIDSWLEDKSSISKEQFSELRFFLLENIAPRQSDNFIRRSCVFLISFIIEGGDMLITKSLSSSVFAETDTPVRMEFYRVGKIIIDFLKSSKHLFMV